MLAAHIAGLPKTKRVEIWFQDEARLGQKNGRARIWAKTGTRPRLPADQRYTNAYLFAAICPMAAKGAALMFPFANTRAMQMHLDEISCNVGFNVYIVKSVVGDSVPLGVIFRGVSWFLACEIVIVSLLVAFPQISLFLPDLMD